MSGYRMLIATFFLFCASFSSAQNQEASSNAKAPSVAKAHYAPDRDYDLIHIDLALSIDYPKRRFRGSVTETFAPLREGLTTIDLQCGQNLEVQSCALGGRAARFTHAENQLVITAPAPLARGKMAQMTIRYRSGKSEASGFTWIKSALSNSDHVGFYTEGEPEKNSSWVPLWDHPNDFATTETRTTVPADWVVVGNGVLVKNQRNADGLTRTFHWKMTQPHATYLLSLVAGKFAIRTTRWRGIPISYLVPKGKGALIDLNFASTPDILAFYSDTFGVPFPWPKYFQTAVYDYRGGIENVSATTISQDELVDKRSGYRSSEPLVAHELAHQWFGDLVTCKDWGEVWLNEGFAVYCTALYFEHSRGKTYYAQFMNGLLGEYFSDSDSDARSLAATVYTNPDAIFNRTTYNKGAWVLQMMRRRLGDKRFFAGLHAYLTEYAHQPVDSHDLCRAMIQATGVNMEPFFDQWVYKPGHPILDYTWVWDEAKHQVVLHIKQLQDTKAGIPVYDLKMNVGILNKGSIQRKRLHLNQVEQTVALDATEKPDAVLLDPDHDLLTQIPTLHWTQSEAATIMKQAPNPVDRQEGLERTLGEYPSEATLLEVTAALRADKSLWPVFHSPSALGNLKASGLRAFFREELNHPNLDRRLQAVLALSQLPKEDEDVKRFAGLVNDQEAYSIVSAAIASLAKWDPAHYREKIRQVGRTVGENLGLKLAVYEALYQADQAEGKLNPASDPKAAQMLRDFLSDIANGVASSSLMTQDLRRFLFPNFVRGTSSILKTLRSIEFLAREEVDAEMHGARIRRIYYFKVISSQRSLYYVLRLTPEGKVGDIDIYPA